jgi:hypothetical protein
MPVVEAECPIFERFWQGGFSTLKISDFLTKRQLYRTPTYTLVLEPCGLEDMLELRLRNGQPGRTMRFGFDRGGGDFSGRDRTVLDLLHPHLVQLHRMSEARRRLREALALHESTQAAVVLLQADEPVAAFDVAESATSATSATSGRKPAPDAGSRRSAVGQSPPPHAAAGSDGRGCCRLEAPSF